MKKFYFLLTLLLALTGNKIQAQEFPTGVLSLGAAETTLETGKWYFLYNQGTGKFIKEENNALKQVGTPNGKDAADAKGYLVTLEEGTDGKYFIKTGLGNYYKGPGSSARGTGASKTNSWAMSIDLIEGTTGHFILQGSTYNMIAPSDGSDIKGGSSKTAGSNGDWVFYNVKTATPDDLTGRDLYNYQMGKLGLIRLSNKRTSTSFLTTTEAGKAVGAPRAASGLSQIWILEKSGEGYSLRSANTGQYLQDSFGSPASGMKVLYIQFSPNNTGDMAYINVSSASDFSGQTCLNLGVNGTNITKWSYKDDAGSDWAIELVSDVTEEEVIVNMNTQKGYASELTDGKYYRILSTAYGVYATEGSDGSLHSIAMNNENFGQFWKLIKSGSGWAFQNVLTEKYIQAQSATSNLYKTGTTKVTLYPRRTSDKWEYKWIIPNSNGGNQGMHTDGSRNVVLWSTSNDGSAWAFQEVELTDEQIEAARGSQQEYNNMVSNIDAYQSHLDNLFEDKACTTLKANIQALTDEQLAQNADFAGLHKLLQEMVLKVKNNTWQQFTNKNTGYTAGYEKFFRIADYKVYSHYQKMCNDDNFTMSNSFGKLSGPTGIVAQGNDIICIYVDQVPSADCTLQLEAVSTEGVPGNNQTGSVTNLHQGLNIYTTTQQMMLYIFYQLNDPKLYLANYPDIKIHIEGGDLHGYWDATRGMTNADWALLQQDLLKNDVCKNLNLKTDHLVFVMDNALVKQCEPKEMEGLMRIWEAIPINEERYMGVEDFEGRYRNIWNVFSINYNYMFASTYGTYYNESTLEAIMNYDNMRKSGSLWGPSHEMGHNHQASINVIGTTESSNNLFSNINTFEQGITTSRRMLPDDSFKELANGTPWLGRDIWNTTSMFFQLYLYFHVMHHDDQFYPNLFRTMRKNPINKWSGPGTPSSYGKDDYLHLAKKICDVAQADLSEFFESYGMFVPVDKYEVGDYSNYTVTTTQKDINDAKKYMQKYPKKLGNIMFIDDHILPMKPVTPDNPFEPQATAGSKKTNNLGQSSADAVGDAGDYEVFDGHTGYDTNNDYCTVSGTTITFKGTGYIGHKFYDSEGNLVWATNRKSTKIPEKIRTLGIENLTIVAAEENMEDVPCPFYKSKTNPVFRTQIYFGNEEDHKLWWTGITTKLNDYLPENAMAVIGSANATENIVNANNVINQDNTAKSIVLNGDLPAYIPVETTAESVKFTKTNTGYAALDLPFDVTSSDLAGLQTASYNNGIVALTDAESVAAGEPVVVNGNVNLTLANAIIKQGSYQELSNVNVLATDGQSVVNAETASPFTFDLKEGTGIQAVGRDGIATNEKAVYDLSGRRIERPAKAGLYIVNGKKRILNIEH